MLTLVLIGTEDCARCATMRRVLEGFVATSPTMREAVSSGRLSVEYLDPYTDPWSADLVVSMALSALPAIVLLDGATRQPLDFPLVGVVSMARVLDLIDHHLPPPLPTW